MAFIHGKNTKILLAGYDVSGYLNNTDVSWDVDAPEATVYGEDSRTYLSGGLKGGTMSFSGFFDASTAANEIDPVAWNRLGKSTSTVLLTYAPQGLTEGNNTYSVQSIETNYTATSPVDGIVTISLDVQNTNDMSRGKSLHNLTARSSGGSGTVVDFSAASSSGGVGFMHATALSLPATESLTLTIQDSPTSSPGTWADLITFTALSSDTVKAERKTVSGNVDRYVRAQWTGPSASWSGTFAITFEQK